VANKNHPGQPHDYLYLGLDDSVDINGDHTLKPHDVYVCAIPSCRKDTRRPLDRQYKHAIQSRPAPADWLA
jgi:hypothetical protein